MILNGFVAILGTTLETTFCCDNRYKTVKNRPICIQLTVLKLLEFAVCESEYSFPSKTYKEI